MFSPSSVFSPSSAFGPPSAVVPFDHGSELPPLDRWLMRSDVLGRSTVVGLIAVGVDHFREVNAALGHLGADGLLDRIAARLHEISAGTGIVTRMRGASFAVVVADAPDTNALYDMAEALLDCTSAPFDTERGTVSISASCGVVRLESAATDIDHLLGHADAAIRAAKDRRRGGVLLFDPHRHGVPAGLLRLRADLRTALRNAQLVALYQPVVSLEDSRVEGVEALVRWQHPELGLLAPADFLSLLEPGNLAADLTEQVLGQALAQLTAWQLDGLVDDDFYVAVNATANELAGPLDSLVHDLLDHHGIAAPNLMIEVTESGLLSQASRGAATSRRLRNLGVQLAVDDFGSATCSLDRLMEWPVTCLKLHRHLVTRTVEDDVAAAIVGGMASMAATLELALVGEGVETAVVSEMLRELHVPSAQGFLWSRPLHAAETPVWLEEYRAVTTANTGRDLDVPSS